jgi:hypothetical protein
VVILYVMDASSLAQNAIDNSADLPTSDITAQSVMDVGIGAVDRGLFHHH